jgi:hypothetical protein
MNCKIIDDAFDLQYLHETYNKILEIGVSITNIANRKTFPYGYEGTHRLMGTTIFSRPDINRVDVLNPSAGQFFDIFDFISNKIQNQVYLKGIYTNVQHTGCNGTTHTDDEFENDYSIIVLTNPVWDTSWGGEFQLMHDHNTVLKTYDYVPGRIIIIPGNRPHRALAPTKEYLYRTSIAYRIEIPENQTLTFNE